MRRTTPLLAAIAVIIGVLAGCSEAKPAESRIAYVIGGGSTDSQSIKEIVLPGEVVNKERDDRVHYVYGNARNYRIAPVAEADENRVLVGTSKSPDDGATPGYGIEGAVLLKFAVNRPTDVKTCKPGDSRNGCRVLEAFFAFCDKYDCQTGNEDDEENLERSSDQGWMNMLGELLGNSLDVAFVEVISGYPVDIVNRPAEWPKIGREMVERMQVLIREAIGLPEDLNVFCATSVITTGKCDPPTLDIARLSSPQADAVLAARRDQENKTRNELDRIANERKVAEAQAALDAEKANRAAELYNQPGYREERQWELLIEAIKACKDAAGVTCIIPLGGSGGTGIQVQIPTGP